MAARSASLRDTVLWLASMSFEWILSGLLAEEFYLRERFVLLKWQTPGDKGVT